MKIPLQWHFYTPEQILYLHYNRKNPFYKFCGNFFTPNLHKNYINQLLDEKIFSGYFFLLRQPPVCCFWNVLHSWKALPWNLRREAGILYHKADFFPRILHMPKTPSHHICSFATAIKILLFVKNFHIIILTKKEPFITKDTNYFTLPSKFSDFQLKRHKAGKFSVVKQQICLCKARNKKYCNPNSPSNYNEDGVGSSIANALKISL